MIEDACVLFFTMIRITTRIIVIVIRIGIIENDCIAASVPRVSPITPGAAKRAAPMDFFGVARLERAPAPT